MGQLGRLQRVLSSRSKLVQRRLRYYYGPRTSPHHYLIPCHKLVVTSKFLDRRRSQQVLHTSLGLLAQIQSGWRPGETECSHSLVSKVHIHMGDCISYQHHMKSQTIWAAMHNIKSSAVRIVGRKERKEPDSSCVVEMTSWLVIKYTHVTSLKYKPFGCLEN